MFKKVLINPVELEYVQFTIGNKDQVYNEVKDLQMNIHPSWDTLGRPCLVIPTGKFDGLKCNIGDFIIKDPNPKDWCKFMCCDELVFKSLMKAFGRDDL